MKKGCAHNLMVTLAIIGTIFLLGSVIDFSSNKENDKVTPTHSYGVEKLDTNRNAIGFDWENMKHIYGDEKKETKKTTKVVTKTTQYQSSDWDDFMEKKFDEYMEDHYDELYDEYYEH